MLYNLNMGEFLSKRKRLICILAPTVFGIFYMLISMFNLQQSVWQGESYGAYLTHYNVAQIWEYSAEANQPPLFFWALKAWAHIFGHTDFAMRFMSVFFGALAIMFAYMWVKYKYGARAAILSSMLLSISPVFIRFGQEMQSYTMAAMFVFAATYFLQLAIDNGQKRWWVIYAVMVALGFWTNYFTLFAWIAHVIYLALIYGKKLAKNKILWTFIIAIVLFVPWLPSLFGQLANRGSATPTINLQTIFDNWGEILLYRETSAISGGLLVLAIITSIVLLALVLRYFKQLRLLLCMILTPTVCLILLSLTPYGFTMTPQRLLYAVASVALIGGVATVIATNKLETAILKAKKKTKPVFYRQPKVVFASLSVVLILSSICGICAIYELGNYNFETDEKFSARQLSRDIITADGTSETPIVVASPDLYYDLSFYDNEKHQSYLLLENQDEFTGFYRPLRDAYFGQIKDLDKFLEKHEAVWYVDAVSEHEKVEFPRSGYRATQILTLGTGENGMTYEAIRFMPE